MTAPTPGRAIIISNGRCGSTLLSDLIAQEPGTLSAQEFLMAAPTTGVLTGAQYWALLSSPKEEVSTLFRMGLSLKEIFYPSNGRWADDLAALPRILVITLAKLTADPDALFDVLAQRVPCFPRQSIGAHHADFLDLLAGLLGRRRWVERSGGSTQIAPFILQQFPTAKVVYLTRNWKDTARSMSRHPIFQLVQLRAELLGRFGVDPFRVTPGQQVPAEMAPLMPDRLTPELLRERGENLGSYLNLCAFISSQAEQALADAPPRHLHTMSYEDLLLDPAARLTELGRFLDFDDPSGWARGVAHRVKAPAKTPQPSTV